MENEQQEPESEGMRNLRESRDREKARADEAEARLRNLVFTSAGVDPESWVGQQLVNTYDGELEPSAIREFASERGIPLAQMGEQPPQATMDTLTAQQAEAQQRMASTMQGTKPRDAELSPEQRAEMALSEGDVRTSIALKAQKLTNKQ